MAKTAQAHEPSMEEILASIRKIISDEEATARPGSRPPLRGVPRPVPLEPEAEEERAIEANAEPQLVSEPPANAAKAEPADEIEGHEDDLVEGPEDEGDAPSEAEANEDAGRDVERTQPAEMPFVDNRILSPGPDAVVTAAFNRLASTILSSQARTLEDLVQDMLRPMLRGWLDENLPIMVERLVREEIERVSRGPKR